MNLPEAFHQDTGLCLDGRISRSGLHPVAAGGYADVWEGFLQSRKVAIKVMRPFAGSGTRIRENKLLRRLWREYLAWSNLSHPNILQCLGFSYDFSPESYVFPSLISPWMANGTAISYLEKYPEADCLELLVGVAKGLSYLHSHEPVIVHGDLRAGNILISDLGFPCLSDFGLSRILNEVRGMTTSTEIAGSLRWMSPELFQADNAVSTHSDVWAYGMTVLEILSGERPYSTLKSDIFAFGQIKDGHTPSRPQHPRALKFLTDQMWAVCRSCWVLQPTQRPLMHMVLSTMLGSDILLSPSSSASQPLIAAQVEARSQYILEDDDLEISESSPSPPGTPGVTMGYSSSSSDLSFDRKPNTFNDHMTTFNMLQQFSSSYPYPSLSGANLHNDSNAMNRDARSLTKLSGFYGRSPDTLYSDSDGETGRQYAYIGTDTGRYFHSTSSPSSSRFPSPSSPVSSRTSSPVGPVSQAYDPKALPQIPQSSAYFHAQNPPVHRSTTLPQSQPSKSSLTSKPFRCPKLGCNKFYKQSNGLKYHLNYGQCSLTLPNREVDKLSEEERHRRLKPFACKAGECSRRYRNITGLKYHYNHSGEHGAIGLQMLAQGLHPFPDIPASSSSLPLPKLQQPQLL